MTTESEESPVTQLYMQQELHYRHHPLVGGDHDHALGHEGVQMVLEGGLHYGAHALRHAWVSHDWTLYFVDKVGGDAEGVGCNFCMHLV